MDAVFIDTCVLFKAYVSDTLLSIAEAGAFRPLWSDDVLKIYLRRTIRGETAHAAFVGHL